MAALCSLAQIWVWNWCWEAETT